MKWLKISVILTVALPLMSFSQGNVVSSESGDQKLLHVDPSAGVLNCISAELEITKDGDVVQGVALECISNYEYKITVRHDCPRVSSPPLISCSTRINISFGDIVLASENLTEPGDFHVSGNFSELGVTAP